MQIEMAIFFVFVSLNAQAQKTQTNCTKYNVAMDSGHDYLIKKDYDKALTEFQAAQIAARECGITKREPADELKKVFEGLQKQRDEADSAKKVAVKSAIETKRALINATNQKLRADSALAKAEKLIHAFYFYDGKFALALKEIKGEKKYGFIDTLGNEVISYKYDKAEQFDNTGFARVKKKYPNKIDSLIDYLLDTTGKEYNIAYKLADLNKDITALDLSGEQLDSFPLEILQYTQLQVLLFGRQYFTILPSGIAQLKDLQILDLSVDSLRALPPEIGQLKNLQTLNLKYKTFTGLLPEIGQLKALQTLNLLGTVNMYNKQFTALPPGIGQLKALQTLNLSQNHLESLPSEIGQLTALQILNLDNNQLTVLPPEIGLLINLQELDLSHNIGGALTTGMPELKLTVLPPQIGQLKNLQILNLHDNHLTFLPVEIGKLENLQILDLSGDSWENTTNKLEVLPSEIGQLKNLIELNLRFNKLTTLPSEIGQLKNLQKLDLTGNPIPESELKQIHSLLPHCVVTVANF